MTFALRTSLLPLGTASLATLALAGDPLPPDTPYRLLPTQPFAVVGARARQRALPAVLDHRAVAPTTATGCVGSSR